MAPGGATRLALLEQSAPAKVLLPRGDLPTAVIVTTTGGMAGGDVLEAGISVGAGAAATIMSQAAEKLYKGVGGTTRVSIRLDVAGYLEWAPLGTILFDGADLDRRTEIDVAEGGRLLASEALVFGRLARGERFASGRLIDRWRVRHGGRLAWADTLGLEGDIAAQLDAAAGFDGAAMAGMLLYVGADAGMHIEKARMLAERAQCRAAATVLGPVLMMRFLGRDDRAVRLAQADAFATMREAVAGLAPVPPKLWSL